MRYKLQCAYSGCDKSALSPCHMDLMRFYSQPFCVRSTFWRGRFGASIGAARFGVVDARVRGVIGLFLLLRPNAKTLNYLD